MKKMNKNIFMIIIVFFLISALLISLQQYITWGSFFEFDDIHHETFIIAFLFGAGLTYILYEISKRS